MIRTIGKIAFTEFKLQYRSMIFIVALLIIVVFSFADNWLALTEDIVLPVYWINSRSNQLLWQGAVLIFIAPVALSRSKRIAPLLWTTGGKVSFLVTGKLAGVWLIIFLLLAIDLIIQVFSVFVRSYGNISGILNIVFNEATIVWFSAILMLATFYFCLSALLKRSALVFIVAAVLFSLVAFRFDSVDPFTLYPYSFASDMVGFGPERRIVLGRAWLYLSFIPLLTTVSIIAYAQNVVFAKLSRSEWIKIATILIFAIMVAGWGIAEWRFRVNQYMLPTGFVDSELWKIKQTEKISDVKVTAYLDLDEGVVEGQVSLTLLKSFEDPLIVYVPLGIRLEGVTNCHNGLLSTNRIDFSLIEIEPASEICLIFTGNWIPNRYSYVISDRFGTDQFVASAFIDDRFAYILPVARWYPSPIGEYRESAGFNIQISIDSDYRWLSTVSGDLIQSDGQLDTIQWMSDHGEPYIGLVAGNYIPTRFPGGDIVWTIPGHERFAGEVWASNSPILQELNAYVGSDNVYHLVETPVLRHPIIAGNMVLLPENRFRSGLRGLVFDMEPDYLNFQAQALWLIRGWLLGQFEFADMETVTDTYPGYIPVDPLLINNPAPDGLAYYMSIVLTERRFGVKLLETGRQPQFANGQISAIGTPFSSTLFNYLVKTKPLTVQMWMRDFWQKERGRTVTAEDILRIAGQHEEGIEDAFKLYYDNHSNAP
ncbi:MAG: ABC transporter permease [Chloroflexi bacterium]|nr:ABC transporter permease [Chloroflexota bacterium]